jgi:hypothetical protein
MPLLETKGAASAQGFGLTLGGAEPVYIEQIFSTYLYTGNGSTQTITNGIDLAGKGGLVWTKNRVTTNSHRLIDTNRGINNAISSNSTAAATTGSGQVTAFNSNGYDLGADSDYNNSAAGSNYASWTFRKQPKFFDVVTYTGDGVVGRTVAHSLGSAPGFIAIKCTSATGNWRCAAWNGSMYQRGLADLGTVFGFNSTAASDSSTTGIANSSTFTPHSVVAALTDVNESGQTYVAYLFAHNAGGFGLTGTDNVISCGSFTTNGSGQATVSLGYEPQWVMYKDSQSTGSWLMMDSMRGMPDLSGTASTSATTLYANTSAAESAYDRFWPTSTGFYLDNGPSSRTFIYIAIRRGPMKVPTDGTKVFQAALRTGTSAPATVTGINFPPDFAILGNRTIVNTRNFWDRLRGASVYLGPNTVAVEVNNAASATAVLSFNMNGISLGSDSTNTANYTGSDFVNYFFQRAPGFFDEICFSGTGANTTQAHNLQKAPELWMVKSRSASTEWVFGLSLLGANEKIVMPSPNGRVTDTTVWNNTYPTSSVLSLGTSSTTNASGATFVGYLMATAAGVSKVGTYTGNGSSQTIDCGFTGGARFVMIIRATASTAQDIYVWDSARGIVAGNDPRLSLNTTAAENTSLDTVDATSTGFIVNTDASNVNVNSAVYLYWSIA